MEFAHHITESVVNILSIGFNVVLMYFIVFHSSFGTRTYQLMLAVDASLDLALSIVVLILQPICFTGAGYKVFVSNGFFAGWSDGFDKWMLVAFFFLIFLNIMWVVIQFVYRYVYLCLRQNQSDKKEWILRTLAVICLVWATLGFLVIYLLCSSSVGHETLELNHWHANPKALVIGAHIDSWLLRAWIALWTFSCTSSIIAVAIFETKIKRHFNALRNTVSHDRTRQMHKDFHRALLAMGICPLMTTSPPILFMMAAAYLRLAPGPMQAFLSILCSSITAFNPLTTMFFMRSYRQKIIAFFRKKPSADVSSATCVTAMDLPTRKFTSLSTNI
ncbi:7TM GPCR protein [Aphelenchoides avenae]|nr:7TM GPCR protein [Aphelenchus avenae]